MFNIVLYSVTLTLLITSLAKDKKKSKIALIKSLKSFERILPQFLAIILIIGILLSVLNPSVISTLIGKQSGIFGMIMAGVIGSITLIPAFVAFPLASALLSSGAGMMQITIFISTLMMVGIITIPIEKSYFGRKATLTRNLFAFLYSFVVAMIIGGILS